MHLQAFSFFSLFLFVGMIGYFFVARYVLKWTTHGEQVSSAGATSSQDAGPDDDWSYHEVFSFLEIVITVAVLLLLVATSENLQINLTVSIITSVHVTRNMV